MAIDLEDRIASALRMAQKNSTNYSDTDFAWDYIEELPTFHVLRYMGEPRDDIDEFTGTVMEFLKLHGVRGLWSGFGYDPIYISDDDELGAVRHHTQISTATVRQFTRLLSQAFELLAGENNIMSAQDFMGCQNCAITAIELAAAKRQDVMGYAFYDRNDAACLDELGWLYVSYGSCHNDSADAHLEIGHTVADALRTVGLRVVWNGQIDHRIRVHLPKIIEQLL